MYPFTRAGDCNSICSRSFPFHNGTLSSGIMFSQKPKFWVLLVDLHSKHLPDGGCQPSATCHLDCPQGNIATSNMPFEYHILLYESRKFRQSVGLSHLAKFNSAIIDPLNKTSFPLGMGLKKYRKVHSRCRVVVLALLHPCLVSVHFSGPSLLEMKFYGTFFPSFCSF